MTDHGSSQATARTGKCVAVVLCLVLLQAAVSCLPVLSRAEAIAAGTPGQVAELRARASRLFTASKYGEAEAACRQLLALEKGSEKRPTSRQARTLMNIATCRLLQSDPAHAKKLLTKLLPVLEKGSPGSFDLADCLYWLGECEYSLGQDKQSRVLLGRALSVYEALCGERSTDLLPCLKSLSGCEYQLQNYQKSIVLYKRIVEIYFGTDQTSNPALMDALLSLADALDKVGSAEQARAVRDIGISMYRTACGDFVRAKYGSRAEAENWAQSKIDEVNQRIDKYVVGALSLATAGMLAAVRSSSAFSNRSPATATKRAADFNTWMLPERTQEQELDDIVIDPTVEQHGILVCIHGFSLSSRAFSRFAQVMAPRGFMVITINMRGFGTNLFSKGFDRFDPWACVDDIRLVLGALRRDNPGVPVFLLGESSGGAVAISVAAKDPKLMDGLLCSVPSGKRFGAIGEKLLVAGRYLRDPRKQFDIGSRIIRKASSDPAIRDAWSSDPTARKEISANELIAFEKFMHESESVSRKVTDVPVIMFQGLSDQLVRPEGTAQLYLSLGARDKDFLVLGAGEHLIFEVGDTPSWVVEMLSSWMRFHATARAQVQ